ncbi:MAG: TraX family protein [Bdellovibrionota bacterium]
MAPEQHFLRNRTQPNFRDFMKAVAGISMLSDHLGVFFYQEITLLRVFGRIAAPLFFFIVGYSLSTKWSWKMFAWGTLLSILSIGFLDGTFLNILFAFLLCRLLFRKWSPEITPRWFLLALTPLLLPSVIQFSSTVLEYGTVGLAWAIAGRLVQQQSQEAIWWTILSSLSYFGWIVTNFDGFTEPNMMLISGGECLLLMMLSRAPFHPPVIPTPFSYLVLFLSRFSLQVYVYHLSFLMLLAMLFGN